MFAGIGMRNFAVVALLLTTAPGVALAQRPAATAASDPCFLSREYQGFHALDDHSFYVRANLRDYFLVETEGSCPGLTDADARLITVEHEETRICGPLDWQLQVASPSQPPIPCIVKSQRRLTPQEAAAIPPKLRP
jgi:hypothetical protein